MLYNLGESGSASGALLYRVKNGSCFSERGDAIGGVHVGHGSEWSQERVLHYKSRNSRAGNNQNCLRSLVATFNNY